MSNLEKITGKSPKKRSRTAIDSAFNKFIYELLITSTRISRTRDYMGSLVGANHLQCNILSVISELEGAGTVSVGDIVAVLPAGRTHVTMETGRLERAGLLTKVPNPDDRRSTLLELTDKGHGVVATLAQRAQEIRDVLFDGLTKSELAAYQSIIAKMVLNTDRALQVAQRSNEDIRRSAKSAA